MGGGDYADAARMEGFAVTAYLRDALSNPRGFLLPISGG